MNAALALVLSAAAMVGGSAQAQSGAQRSDALVPLIACRSLADAERLACYDRQVALLDEADRSREIAVVSGKQVDREKPRFLGLDVEGDTGGTPRKELDAALVSASVANGRLLLRLDNGTTWRQTDAVQLARTPQAGQRIRIRKAALGSFLANVDGQVAIRVRRVE